VAGGTAAGARIRLDPVSGGGWRLRAGEPRVRGGRISSGRSIDLG
jgi:hypothetical protein